MGKSQVRNDKTCLNCFHVVENRFCGNCGQENIDTRKTFHHLFIHFFEDLTHYENSFWRTIRNLLFKPAALSKEYLSGKRMSYLAPVRLYIFISFITFFLMAVLRSNSDEVVTSNLENRESSTDVVTSDPMSVDQSDESAWKTKSKAKENFNVVKKDSIGTLKISSAFGFKSVAEFDSIQKFGAEEDKVPVFLHDYIRKSIVNADKFTGHEIAQKVSESIMHSFPKVLLVYMPIFAFFLWLFHDKKRWYYFDHGIFTLHYFSFLLLITLILFLKSKLLEFLGTGTFLSAIDSLTDIVGFIWMFYYFFSAHYRFYGSSKGNSFLKSLVLLMINIAVMIVLFAGLFIYSFINIH